MDKQRLKQKEIPDLKKVTGSVRWDLTSGFRGVGAGYVVLVNFPFPRGWKPRKAYLLYTLPASYPAEMPRAFIDEDMRYKGGVPEIMQLDWGPDGVAEHCIHQADLRNEWTPEANGLISMTRTIKRSLMQPYSNNPFR